MGGLTKVVERPPERWIAQHGGKEVKSSWAPLSLTKARRWLPVLARRLLSLAGACCRWPPPPSPPQKRTGLLPTGGTRHPGPGAFFPPPPGNSCLGVC